MRDFLAQPQYLTISETSESKKYWLQQGLGKGFESNLASADVLLVPEKDFREGVPFVFHQDTPSFYRYLSSRLLGQATVEICATDDEYLEISLHSATFRISRIVANYVIAPMLIGILTNYIYDELKAKPSDSVEVSLTIEDHECKSFNFSFSGEAKDFNLLADKVGQMSRDCQAKKMARK